MLWLLILLVPVAFSRTAQENFRLPKLLISECLALASLIFLAWRWRALERIEWRTALRQPVILAILPVLAVATSGLLTSSHPLHVREALVSLWIGAVCMICWSFALTGDEHRDLLRGMVIPATVLSLLAVLQFHQLFNPFRFEHEVNERIGLTSLAGSAFDLAAYLVVPCLIAQLAAWQERSLAWRVVWVLIAALCFYAMLATRTLTALAAVFVGSLVLWLWLLPRQRVAAAALILIVGVASSVAFSPLRERLERKIVGLRKGEVNRVLTGRLDGWRTAWWMFSENPVSGVGHGAYRAEFGLAKQALHRDGVRFYRSQHQVHFTNAHSEFLHVLAEWGALGVAALLWGIAMLIRTLRRSAMERPEAALKWAAVVALAILALTNFPFHIALSGYPALLLLSWVFAAEIRERPA